MKVLKNKKKSLLALLFCVLILPVALLMTACGDNGVKKVSLDVNSNNYKTVDTETFEQKLSEIENEGLFNFTEYEFYSEMEMTINGQTQKTELYGQMDVTNQVMSLKAISNGETGYMYMSENYLYINVSGQKLKINMEANFDSAEDYLQSVPTVYTVEQYLDNIFSNKNIEGFVSKSEIAEDELNIKYHISANWNMNGMDFDYNIYMVVNDGVFEGYKAELSTSFMTSTMVLKVSDTTIKLPSLDGYTEVNNF